MIRKSGKPPMEYISQKIMQPLMSTWGEVTQIGALWNMADLPLRLARASPALGQHSREICQEIGLDMKLYEALKAKELLVD